jgi:hypothetical protein
MPAPLEFKTISINADGWTPVVVPFDCSSIAIKNNCSSAVKMRTNANDVLTQDMLAAGCEQMFAVPFHRYRFLAGAQPLWLQASAGTGPMVVKFLA